MRVLLVLLVACASGQPNMQYCDRNCDPDYNWSWLESYRHYSDCLRELPKIQELEVNKTRKFRCQP